MDDGATPRIHDRTPGPIRRLVWSLILAGFWLSTEPWATTPDSPDDSNARIHESRSDLAGDSPNRWYPPVEDRTYWKRNLFKRILEDQKFLVTTWWPAELRNPAFTAPLGVSTALALSSGRGDPGIDDRLESHVAGTIRGRAYATSTAVSRIGDGEIAVVLIGGAYLFSRLTRDVRLSETTSLSAEAMVNAGLWSIALKALTSRARPGRGQTSALFNAGASTRSFPSGHTMGAFAVAAVVAGQYRHRKWVPWVAYGTAGLIAASRVTLGQHYVSDVVAGAVLGRSLGNMTLLRAHGDTDTGRRVRWSPWVDPSRDGYGVAVTVSW